MKNENYTKWCKSLNNFRGSGGKTGTAIIPALKQLLGWGETINKNIVHKICINSYIKLKW
jgi:hypothetical protein